MGLRASLSGRLVRRGGVAKTTVSQGTQGEIKEMNTSTIEARGGVGKRLGVLLLGLAVALAGLFAFSGSQADAAEKTITFDKGKVNLGFAFQNRDILPAPQAIAGTVSNPNFNPANPVSPENSPTTISPTGTPLFDINALDPATFTTPGSPLTQPVNSFTPIGCGTPVTFGIYFAVRAGQTPSPSSIIWNPAPAPGNPFSPLLGQPLTNAGLPGSAPYYRVLPAGAILAPGSPDVTFANPFAAVPGQPANITLTAPYPAANTLWQPYAASGGNVTNPASIFPQGVGGTTPFSGAAGLRAVPNPLGYCPNPANGTATVDEAAGGAFTGTAEDFDMPVMVVPNPLDQSPVPITLEAPEGIEGTIDDAGNVRIDGDMEVRVLTGLATNPLGSYCSLPLPGREPGGFNPSQPIPDNGFALTTDYSLPTAQGYAGTPFSGGDLEGDGALVGTWNTTEDSISVGGANCATVNSVSKGFGGIWLSSGIAEPAPFPTCAELGLIGNFADCEDPVASIGKVTVSGPGKAKRGKTATWRVRIPNTGNIALTGVRTSVSGRGVKVNTPVATIAPGTTRTETIRAKLNRAGKFTLTIKVTSANGGSKTVKRAVTVR